MSTRPAFVKKELQAAREDGPEVQRTKMTDLQTLPNCLCHGNIIRLYIPLNTSNPPPPDEQNLMANGIATNQPPDDVVFFKFFV